MTKSITCITTRCSYISFWCTFFCLLCFRFALWYIHIKPYRRIIYIYIMIIRGVYVVTIIKQVTKLCGILIWQRQIRRGVDIIYWYEPEGSKSKRLCPNCVFEQLDSPCITASRLKLELLGSTWWEGARSPWFEGPASSCCARLWPPRLPPRLGIFCSPFILAGISETIVFASTTCVYQYVYSYLHVSDVDNAQTYHKCRACTADSRVSSRIAPDIFIHPANTVHLRRVYML